VNPANKNRLEKIIKYSFQNPIFNPLLDFFNSLSIRDKCQCIHMDWPFVF